MVSGVSFASTTDGTVSGYAWSDKMGWINFGLSNGNIHITDSLVSGYAWSDNFGWINFAPTKSGVTNDGTGALSGYAWSSNIGWINFSGVTVSSSGVFSGTATGENAGTINFSCSNCNVTTDWRPDGYRCGDGICNGTESCQSCHADCVIGCGDGGTGGGGNTGDNLAIKVDGTVGYGGSQNFYAVIPSGSGDQIFTINSKIFLNLFASSSTEKMMISENPNFSDAIKEDYKVGKFWELSKGDGLKTIYVKYFDNLGKESPVFVTNFFVNGAPNTNSLGAFTPPATEIKKEIKHLKSWNQ